MNINKYTRSKQTAYVLVRTIRSHRRQHVFIKPSQQYYKVRVGPFHNNNELQDFYQSYQNPPPSSTLESTKNTITLFDESSSREHIPSDVKSTEKPLSIQEESSPHHWYINGLAGAQFNGISSSTTVNNGLVFSSPYNLQMLHCCLGLVSVDDSSSTTD